MESVYVLQVHTCSLSRLQVGLSHWPSAFPLFVCALQQSLYSLLKCKLIKVNVSSLKSFRGWVAPMSQPPPPFFIFASCPSSSRCDGLPLMWNCTICIADAGLRVRAAAVLMSQMQSEMAAQELIGPPHYFLPTASLSPLLSLHDSKSHKVTSGSETRFASCLEPFRNFPMKLHQLCLFWAAFIHDNQRKGPLQLVNNCLHSVYSHK